MIAVCPNPYRDIDLVYTRRVVRDLANGGYATKICPVFAEIDDEILPDDLSYSRIEEIGDPSLAVVIGGDGTILSVARKIVSGQTPIFGINLGTKGFLCTTDPSDRDCESLLMDAASGALASCNRMLLDIKVFREDACIYVDYALNDAVLHGYIDCIQTDVFINDVMIKSYFGDGIIVSTPTGSTGYSMSAGGPIVEPSAENFIITPICAHSLSARSYVFSSDNQVKIQAERLHGRRAYLSVDGGESLELMNGDSIIISRSSCHFSILERDRYSYYENISNKLS
jgi:NAD+ kinase